MNRIRQDESNQLSWPEAVAILVVGALFGGFVLAFVEQLIEQHRKKEK